MKKGLGIVLILMMLSAHTAWATVYECHVDQAFTWTDGRLSSKNNLGHVVIQFDDKSGVLLWAFTALHSSNTALFGTEVQ